MTTGTPRPLLGGLLPDGVRAAEVFGDLETALFPEERAVIGRAVAARQREFATVRHCARQALSALGHPPGPLLPGERGAPRWPEGVVGSMTHCAGYRAAAVAPRRDVRTLGIDATPHGPLPRGVLAEVAGEEERRHLAELSRVRPEVHWDRVLFSAKEALYKAWFPLYGSHGTRWGFRDANVRLCPGRKVFRARLPATGTGPGGGDGGVGCGGGGVGCGDNSPIWKGRWLTARGLVLTAVVDASGRSVTPAS
ncbi:4'-phosphopantetheinyl transferase [Streptomyces sp. NPDC058622]|uniref:4'-phosphopantetheinyl transferase family protein n=1 Tax=Streptomyces sp. NPDC058622 TaxID=3346562 RepID=UPI00365C1DDE